MSLEPKTCECPCGEVITLPIVKDPFRPAELVYEVCNVQCPKCRRSSTGGNGREGVISGWITARDLAISEANYAQQLWESDNNEWYGRGQW